MICKSFGLAGLLLYLIRKAYITHNGQVQNFVMQSLMLDNSFSSFQLLAITLNVFLLLHLFLYSPSEGSAKPAAHKTRFCNRHVTKTKNTVTAVIK